MRRVQQIMGMPISIDIPVASDNEVFDKTFLGLSQIDRAFSLYKPASEASLFAKGQIKEANLSSQLKTVIGQCRKWQKQTGGYFSAWASGRFDPSGYVKGWAIAEAARHIKKTGYGTFCIAAGGDILAASDSSKIWQIGLQDPRRKDRIINKLSIANGAVCTSGRYERGDHIFDPATQRPAVGPLSVTISGPDIIWADVLATACFVAGPLYPDLMKKFPAYQLIVVD